MARNDGKKYEGLLHEMYQSLASGDPNANVTMNVMMPGQDGDRQIDVLIMSEVAGMPLKTVIECKDHNKKIDVMVVDAFHSKLMDVGANKGVLVARKGFSGKARRKAERLGITACTADRAPEILKRLGIQIPVIVTEVVAHVSDTAAILHLVSGAQFKSDAMFAVNDKNVVEVFRDEVIQGAFQIPLQSGRVEWAPKSILGPHYIRDVTGAQHELESPKFFVQITASYYFGHVSDLPKASALHDQKQGKAHLFFKTEDFPDYKKRLAKYNEISEIPKMEALMLVSVALPTIIQSSKFRAFNSATGQEIGSSARHTPPVL